MTPVVRYVITASLAIAVFLALALHAVFHGPRRCSSWVFAAFCLTVIIYYLSNLFLFAQTLPDTSATPVALRVKWAAVSFSPNTFFHMLFFYFPPAWQRLARPYLPAAYLFSGGLAGSALFGNLLIRAPLYRPAPYIIGVVPGPLMYVLAGLFLTALGIATAGLLVAYRSAGSPSRRQQLRFLLVPVLLVVLSAGVAWVCVGLQGAGTLPHELMDVLLILAGLFYGRAVVHYGSFTGRRPARSFVVYSIPGIVLALASFYATIRLDMVLARYTPHPYPLFTGMLIIILVLGLPHLGPWLRTRRERQRPAPARPPLPPVEPPPDTPLEIRVLGPLQVRVLGKRVSGGAWSTERAKALLAYLICVGDAGATRAEISAALWPDRPVEESANVFHVTLHHLRHALEPDLKVARNSRYIRHRHSRYRFNADAPHWLDVKIFRALVSANDATALERAVTLYRGHYLEDIEEPWPTEMEAERRTLERAYEDALRRLVAVTEGQKAEIYLEKFVAVAPADEAAQSALVQSYLDRGRPDLALHQVMQWQAALEELGITPSAQAHDLWRSVGAGHS